nr:CPPV338 hypothetical protein [Cooks petrelpox virus]
MLYITFIKMKTELTIYRGCPKSYIYPLWRWILR